MLINYVPVLIFMVVAIGLVAVIVLLSELLGKKKHSHGKLHTGDGGSGLFPSLFSLDRRCFYIQSPHRTGMEDLY
jgi:NADH:ubiquinone oxidoreductase subunit 3 (subunit A)